MSYRTCAAEPDGMMPTAVSRSTVRREKPSRPSTEKSSNISNRLSMTSSGPGKRSSASFDGPATIAQSRPTGIPRPSRVASNSRGNTVLSSKPAVVSNAKSKTLSIARNTTLPAQNRVGKSVGRSGNEPKIVTDDDLAHMEPTLPFMETEHEALLSITNSHKQPSQPLNFPPRLIPELQALAADSYRRPTPAMSTISTISSPSTQFTTSPSPWSASTTTTTPTSWSSASPSILQSTRAQTPGKRSQTIPMPTATRNNMPKLPILQESVTNSASSSITNIRDHTWEKSWRSARKTPVASPAPTPPPRSSSIKRTRSRSGSKGEGVPSGDQEPSNPPPLPQDQDISPTVKHVETSAERQKQSVQAPAIDRHQKLQDAINFVPSRPSRENIQSLVARKPHRVNDDYPNLDQEAKKLLDAPSLDVLSRSDSNSPLRPTRSIETESSASAQPTRSRLNKFSRMGTLFARSPKKESTREETQNQPRKLQRQGPSAGTGHEGYGKFRRREKKVSSDGNQTGTDSESSTVSISKRPPRSSSRKESSSMTRRDRSSQSDLDDFVTSRLKPVVILGGSRKEGASSSDYVEPEQGNLENNATSSPQDQIHRSRIASTGPLMRESRLIFHLDSLEPDRQPSLAIRRSQKFSKGINFNIPEPIDTSLSSSTPYLNSYNTSQSSIVPTSAALTEGSTDLYRSESHLPEKQRKKGRKLNWNIFKKKESGRSTTPVWTEPPQMAVKVSTLPSSRSVPYYAMPDSENEGDNAETVDDLLPEAAPVSDEEDNTHVEERAEKKSEKERPASILLPSAPQVNRPYTPVKHTDPSVDNTYPQNETLIPSQGMSYLRQPRLAQVGRIPKVVPSIQRSTANIASFSRPFQQDQKSSAAKITTRSMRPPAPAPAPAPLTIHTDILPSRPFNEVDSGKPFSAPVRAEEPAPFSKYSQTRELPKLFDRYSTTSSSSDGMISVMGPPLLPPMEPQRKSHRYTATEEDVWNEYDEFIDRVISPPRLKKSKARITEEHKVKPLPAVVYPRPIQQPQERRQVPQGLAIDTFPVPPPLIFASPSDSPNGDAEQDFRLRRSRIVSALHSSIDPSSPFSIGDYLADHGEKRRSSIRTSARLSGSTVSQVDKRSPKVAFLSAETPVTPIEHKHYDEAAQIDNLERAKNPARHSERSYASLMVSRWLSFGRVLFSPAHAEIQKQSGRHILVIDGLGNEDWSIYCAVTYQTEQAYIYDLKETGHVTSSHTLRQPQGAPANIRRRELADFNEAFKFPDNFFSVIVLRFPPVMAESKLKNIMSECRRVLAPGGFIELMLLDLDIVNMGVTTRRAMRELKTKIAMDNREVSLKSVIDNVQSVLHEKGFSKLSKCVVGVPVIGRPPESSSPTSSRSSGGSDGYGKHPSAGPRQFDNLTSQQDHNFSLNDLVADHSDNADAKISKIVSRTARSWWQHCFEATFISDSNLSTSIFADKEVVSECKSRASSFKLLIAYTQKSPKPTLAVKRRTMSEPMVATLATAGTS